jgi:D-arabinose 1-dehydrogenase-like Zn-dependent alcohol dehydrogenase
MNLWDSRFNGEDFLYGKEPNEFFAGFISQLSKKGKLLLPAEGEGRNAVFAAKMGWEVTAIDSSAVGRDKALKFAKDEGVEINYEIFDLSNFETYPAQYDLIALVFGHFASDIRRDLHYKFIKSLKKGGHLLVEAFAKEQINNNSGGPKDIDMLYSLPMLTDDFSELSILKLCQEKVFLNEGLHHGWAAVVRFIGEKI